MAAPGHLIPAGRAENAKEETHVGTNTAPTRPSRHPSDHPSGAPLLVAVPITARLLGIGTTLAWDLVRSGDIPSVKLGRRVLVPLARLERLVGAREG